jgi:hypothetical protein
MLTNDFRIARVQKSLRWFENDIPLLNMRVKELSAERQEQARRFAAAVVNETRAELEKLLRERSDDSPCADANTANANISTNDAHCEPAD